MLSQSEFHVSLKTSPQGSTSRDVAELLAELLDKVNEQRCFHSYSTSSMVSLGALDVFTKGESGRNTRAFLRVIILVSIAIAAVSSRLFSVISTYAFPELLGARWRLLVAQCGVLTVLGRI